MLSSTGSIVCSILLSFTYSTSCIIHFVIRLRLLFLQSIRFKHSRYISRFGLTHYLTWTNGRLYLQGSLCSWLSSSCTFIQTENWLWWTNFLVPLDLLLPLCTTPTTSTLESITEGLLPFGIGSVTLAIFIMYIHSDRELAVVDKFFSAIGFITATVHNSHHKHSRINYGGLTAFWDWLCNTGYFSLKKRRKQFLSSSSF